MISTVTPARGVVVVARNANPYTYASATAGAAGSTANTVYALDATIIDLCLSVFPWARYRRRDASIKLHTQVDLRGLIARGVQTREGTSPITAMFKECRIAPRVAVAIAAFTREQ
jgi:hypothetical protein